MPPQPQTDSPDVTAEHEALLDFMYQVPIGLVQFDNDGAVEMINPMSVRLLLPLSPNGRLSNLFVALQSVAPELRQEVARFPAPSGTICRQHRVSLGVPAPGETVPQVLEFTLIRLAPARIMAVITDASVAAANEARLRESEAFSRRIIDTAPDPIIVIDDAGRMARVNRRAEQAFGYASEELLSQPVEMLMPERFRHGHVAKRHAFMAAPEAHAANLAGQDGAAPRTVAGQRKDGSEFSVEAGLGAVEMNQRPHAVAVLRDITERQQAQAALLRLNAELEQRVIDRTEELVRANREMASFSYTVAHDLRAPLRSIGGFASLLRMDTSTSPDERNELLDRINAAARRMAAQIDGLLALSQLSRADTRPQTLNLSAVAQAAVTELRQLEPARDVDVSIAETPDCVADPALAQVLMQNLIGNAWKYTGKTPHAVIRFEARRHDGHTEYCVSDNGAGFDMQHAGRLFEVFQRMHRQDEFDGVGIGLATVRRIIERHGGTIRAESSPGQGARFCFTLGPGN